jgi:phage-related protein
MAIFSAGARSASRAVSAVRSAVSSAVSSASRAVSAVTNSTRSAVSSAVSSASNATSQARSAVASAVSKGVSTAKGVVQSTPTQTSTIQSSVQSAISALSDIDLKAITNRINEGINKTKDVATNLPEKTKDAINDSKDIFNQILNYVDAGLNAVWNAINQLPIKIYLETEKVKEYAFALIETIKQELNTRLETGLNTIKDSFDGIWTYIQEKVQTILDTFRYINEEIMPYATENIQNMWSAMSEVAIELDKRITDYVEENERKRQAQIDDIKKWGKESIDPVKEKMDKMWDELMEKGACLGWLLKCLEAMW